MGFVQELDCLNPMSLMSLLSCCHPYHCINVYVTAITIDYISHCTTCA